MCGSNGGGGLDSDPLFQMVKLCRNNLGLHLDTLSIAEKLSEVLQILTQVCAMRRQLKPFSQNKNE